MNEFRYLGYFFKFNEGQVLNIDSRKERVGKSIWGKIGQIWGIGKRRFMTKIAKEEYGCLMCAKQLKLIDKRGGKWDGEERF